MTAMPEKLSWEKSDSWEKASCRMSHFFIMYLPTTALDAQHVIVIAFFVPANLAKRV